MLRLVTGPATQPVSLVEAKAQLRVEHDDDDALIEALIKAATERLDGYGGALGRCLISQTWEIDIEETCAARSSALGLAPARSISGIAIVSISGTEAVLPEADWPVALRDGRIVRRSGLRWPDMTAPDDRVVARLTFGYGLAPADVPAPLRQAILVHVASLYENRQSEVIGASVEELPYSYGALIGPYKRWSV